MRDRRLVSLAGAVILLASMTPAALAQSSSPLPQVRIAVWSGPEADNLRKVAAAYTEATGNPTEIEEIARDGYSDKLKTSIVGGSSDFDVVYASADWVPAFIAADGLEPLDAYIANDAADFLNVDDLQPGVSNLTFDGKIYGFPSEGDTAWLFYRKDLLDAAGIDAPQDDGRAARSRPEAQHARPLRHGHRVQDR